MRVVGLTGGIGSGKSTVARMFKALGAEVIDADVLAREVVEPGQPALARIRERFGAEVFDVSGALDRKKLAAIVFGDEKARADLNAIVHPAVAQRAQEEILACAGRGARLILYDVPLLYESGLDKMFPDVIVVDAPESVRRVRLADRDHLSEQEIDARLRAQMPLEEKVKRATFVVDNGGTRDATEASVRALYRALALEG